VRDGARVAGGEVQAADVAQLIPRQRVVGRRPEPIADHGDGPLAAVVQVDERAPRRRVSPRHVNLDAELGQAALGPVAELVVA
jgi:hypothetical protein